MSVFRNSDPVVRAKVGRAAVTAAYAADNADDIITEGDWAGFTRAEAHAWCWNLYQYEPHGFVYPAKMARMRREQELEAGGIPEGGAYAEKARQYIERGVTPVQYREAREVLASPTFSWCDVTYIGGAPA